MSSALAVLAVLTVRGRFVDPDTWWHLKLGEVIWTTHTIPTQDLFSFTVRHHASIPAEWLSQWLIYGSYRLAGYSGMMVWLCFFTTAVLVGSYALCSVYSGNAKVGFLGAMVVWFFATVGVAVRPQLIGYFLLVLELLLLHLGRTRNPRWFIGLPFLFLLWVNIHGSFFFGLVVLGTFLFCSFFDFQAGALVSQRMDPGARRFLIVVAVCSTVAVFLNPLGVKQVFYPVNTMLHQPVNLSNVQEWHPLVLSDPRGAGLLGILAFISIYLMVQKSARLFLDELLLLALGAWLALSYQRLAFVFGILAAPVVARLLANSWENYDPEKDLPAPNAVFIALAALAIFFAFPSRQSLVKQIDAGCPVKAVEYITTHHLSGNMLNAYGYGGYLIWALPEHPVFIDGRADLYEWAGVLSQFGRWAMLQEDPNQLLDKYNVSFCLLERGSPITNVLPLLPNWKEVYSDDRSVIFVRTSAGSPST
jgi:hypothetical protein